MTPENLDKCYSFIGPMYVGKSLISEEFAKKQKLPIINIDNLRSVMDSERNGQLSDSPKVQKKFLKYYVDEIMEGYFNSSNATSKSEAFQFKEEAEKIVQNYIDLYKYYLELLNLKNFEDFYCYFDSYYDSMFLSQNHQERILYGNALVCKIIDLIFKHIDKPIILDLPGYFGCIKDSENISKETMVNLENSPFHIEFEELKKNIKDILCSTQTILLTPGQDYKFRNASKKDSSNSLLVNNLEDYMTNATIEISTNGLFFNPEHKCFKKKRNYFDIETQKIKSRLKNKSELDNICDQITTMLTELEDINEI